MRENVDCVDSLTLATFLLGRMAEEEAAALEQHLEHCPQCKAELLRVRAEDGLVEALRAGPPFHGGADQAVIDALVECCRVLTPPTVAQAGATTVDVAAGVPPADQAEPTSETATAAYAFVAPPREAGEVGRLGLYRVLRLLGRGGMGAVFEAEDPALKRKVALKVLLDARYAEPRYVARFRAEAEAVARLCHPNIVQIHEVGEHDGRPYIALEFVAGGSLAQHLGGQPQPSRASAELVATLARAVHYAHEHQIVHRDLKPANVLLQMAEGLVVPPSGGEASPPEGGTTNLQLAIPKVTDFGLAKRLDEEGLTQTGELLGTPSYMAQEVTHGIDRWDESGPRVDIYALGAILYELLTGRPPFRGETVADTLEQVRTQEPVPPSRLQPKVPRELETICLKSLEKEPARRYASAQELADDLNRFLRGEPIRARPASLGLRLAKWARRKPALAALLALSGLFLLTVVAGSLVYSARLRAAVDRAEANEAQTRRQYQEAHAALERMLGRLQGPRLQEVPRLKELQRDLLEDALTFYQGSLQQAESPDPAVRRDTAVACRRAADIQQVLGQYDSALANYRRAIELVEGLPREDQADPELRALVATCYLNWGTAAGAVGRAEEAERRNQAALDILSQLAEARPADPFVQSELAKAEHDRGAVCQSTRPAEAEAHYARAVAVRTALVRDHPEEEGYQVALAEDYVNLGLLLRGIGRGPEASPVFAKAEGLLRPLVDRHPAEARYALSLVALYVNWSYLLAETGRSREALDRLDWAVRLAEDALRKEPQDRGGQQRAMAAHGARAEINEFAGRFADSVKDWDRVVELTEGAERFHRRRTRARLLTRAGDHARAAAEAGALAKQPEATGDSLYLLARVYVLAIKPARADRRLSSAEREAQAERYASTAVDLLKKLHGQGYFNDAAHARALKAAEDWQPLRGRDDFRRLLTAVGNK
jgi:tetratricopeptide (TPR) repeat protein